MIEYSKNLKFQIVKRYILIASLFIFYFIGQPSFCYGQSDTLSTNQPKKKKVSFRDPVDNAFDMSSFLLEHKGLLPVPVIITEPALGYGGGAALVYFHHRKKQYKSYVMPDVSGVLGFGTANGTWGVGGLHAHTFGENRVRTITAFIKPNVNFDYYGNNSELLAKNPLTVKLKTWLIYQSAQVRIAKSKFYLGAAYTYSNSNVSLDTIPGRPLINAIIKRLNMNSVVSTLSPTVVFDSRDNAFTPTKGINAELTLKYSAKWLGSSDDYNVIKGKFYGYQPITPRLFSGWRFESSSLLGDAPFYAYPFVSLRGIPAMRYQSDNTMVAETEWRYNVYKRLSLVAFTGTGKAFQSFNSFSDSEWAYTVGTGFRYEIARRLGTHMGIDFAWGNAKDFAFYIVFGSSWW
jgi:hypothetical protein